MRVCVRRDADTDRAPTRRIGRDPMTTTMTMTMMTMKTTIERVFAIVSMIEAPPVAQTMHDQSSKTRRPIGQAAATHWPR
jgi:hypothetical protein